MTDFKDEVVVVKNPGEMRELVSAGMLYIRKLEMSIDKIAYPVTVRLTVVDDQFVLQGLFGAPTFNSIEEFMNKFELKA